MRGDVIAIGAGNEAQSGTTSISVTAWMMQPGDDKVVAERIYSVLSAKRGPRSTAMPAPSANVRGRWDVDIEFFSSRSRHTLFIEQDGNWIQGSHQGDFTSRDLVGMIEGNEVKLRSVEREPVRISVCGHTMRSVHAPQTESRDA